MSKLDDASTNLNKALSTLRHIIRVGQNLLEERLNESYSRKDLENVIAERGTPTLTKAFNEILIDPNKAIRHAFYDVTGKSIMGLEVITAMPHLNAFNIKYVIGKSLVALEMNIKSISKVIGTKLEDLPSPVRGQPQTFEEVLAIYRDALPIIENAATRLCKQKGIDLNLDFYRNLPPEIIFKGMDALLPPRRQEELKKPQP